MYDQSGKMLLASTGPPCVIVSPGLSSYAAPIEEVRRALVDVLQRQLGRDGAVVAPQEVVFDPVFVSRGSHGPAPAGSPAGRA